MKGAIAFGVCAVLLSAGHANSAAASPRVEAFSEACTTKAQGIGLLALGPIDAVDPATQTAVIAGLRFRLSSSAATNVETGSYSAAFGCVTNPEGPSVVELVDLGTFVPGSSPLFVVGTIAEVRPEFGLLKIGAQWVDYSGLLAAKPELAFRVGETIHWGGTRASVELARLEYVRTVILVPSEVGGKSSVALQGITGTALQGITGTALQGITGTAVQGITGTALQGITGTAVQGITGTALQGITGTAVQGITGTALQGITGTAVQGITGTALQGITGTAVQGITGTALQGITGTALQGITGTAVQGRTEIALAGSEVLLGELSE